MQKELEQLKFEMLQRGAADRSTLQGLRMDGILHILMEHIARLEQKVHYLEQDKLKETKEEKRDEATGSSFILKI